jgi:hypothetical protein
MAHAKTSFFQRLSEASDNIYEIRIPCADGRQAFYRVAVRPVKDGAFRKAIKEGRTVDLHEYGDVIEARYLPKTIN